MNHRLMMPGTKSTWVWVLYVCVGGLFTNDPRSRDIRAQHYVYVCMYVCLYVCEAHESDVTDEIDLSVIFVSLFLNTITSMEREGGERKRECLLRILNRNSVSKTYIRIQVLVALTASEAENHTDTCTHKLWHTLIIGFPAYFWSLSLLLQNHKDTCAHKLWHTLIPGFRISGRSCCF
jgi:hypothetical protein